jgi:hypothetical protein
VFQFDEQGTFTAQEFYDPFIDDPTDFMMRAHLQRICGKPQPLQKLASFTNWFGYYISIVGSVAPFGLTEAAEAFQSLHKAGAEALKWISKLSEETMQTKAMGFPVMRGGSSAAPFDIVGDWFRGTRGIMLDMFRTPDKLLAAMDKLVPIMIKMGIEQAAKSDCPIIAIMLHKGAEGFMSLHH